MSPSNRPIKAPIVEQASGFPLYVLISAICLLGSGVVHGLWTDRWEGTTRKPGSVVLNRVPEQIGQWNSEPLPPLDHPDTISSLYRRYTNELTGRSVNVLLTAGDPSTVAEYSIARLFPGHSYRQVSDPAPINIQSSHEGFENRVLHAFLTADYYEPSSLKTEQLLTVWGWSENGIWESPLKPESRFEKNNEVYRLYVTQTWDFAAQSRPNDIQDFLIVAIPRFSKLIGRIEQQPPTEEGQP